MTDIASFITQDPKTGTSYIDWLMDGPDLASDEGLATAVLISLFTDRLADDGETIGEQRDEDRRRQSLVAREIGPVHEPVDIGGARLRVLRDEACDVGHC